MAKPGDKLPVTGLDWRIVSSAGKSITDAAPRRRQAQPGVRRLHAAQRKPDRRQRTVRRVASSRSVSSARSTSAICCGTKNKTSCARTTRLGTVDLYIASHHGIDASGSPALVHGLQPRVAIEQNGTRKGGTVQTNKTLYSSPGFEDLWQLHWSYNVGTEYNPAGIFIANIDEPAVIATC